MHIFYGRDARISGMSDEYAKYNGRIGTVVDEFDTGEYGHPDYHFVVLVGDEEVVCAEENLTFLSKSKDLYEDISGNTASFTVDHKLHYEVDEKSSEENNELTFRPIDNVVSSPKQTDADIHKEIVELLHDTYVQKNNDYGNSVEKVYLDEGVGSLRTRMKDKMHRIDSLTRGNARQVADEKLDDTAIDLANYAIILAMLVRKHGIR